MKVYIKILCCAVLVLGPALAIAMGWFGSKESLPSKGAAPTEPNQPASSNTPVTKAGAPADATPTQSPAPAESPVLATPPSLPVVPALPPTGQTGPSKSADKIPSDFPPALGTTVPGKAPQGPASLPILPAQGAASATQAAPPSTPALPPASPQVVPVIPPYGEMGVSGSAGKAPSDSPAATQPGIKDGDSQQAAPVPALPALPAGVEPSGAGAYPGKAEKTGTAPGELTQRPTPETPQAPVTPTASPAGSIKNRFTDWSEAFKTGETWTPTDCGCVPIVTAFDTYGFYPESIAAKDPVNFGVWSRIGYYAVTPTETGHVMPSQSKDEAMGKRRIPPPEVAHRYGTKVDLVIRNNAWARTKGGAGIDLDRGGVIVSMTDEIVELVEKLGFDGVTIDFDLTTLVLPTSAGSPDRDLNDDPITRLYVQGVVTFIQKLNRDLDKINPHHHINLVLEYKGEGAPPMRERLFTKEDLKRLYDSVDLFLFVPDYERVEGVKVEKNTEVAMTQFDNYFWDYTYGDVAAFEKKLIFIVDPRRRDVYANEVMTIRGDRFGGVGSWILGPSGDTDLIRESFINTTVWIGGVQKFLRIQDVNPFPGPFCKVVCPNRALFVGVAAILTVVYAGAFSLSLFSPVVMRLVHQHLRYVIAGALLIVLIILSLLLCVQQWRVGWEIPLTVLFIVLVGGYAFKSMMDKKREANYP